MFNRRKKILVYEDEWIQLKEEKEKLEKEIKYYRLIHENYKIKNVEKSGWYDASKISPPIGENVEMVLFSSELYTIGKIKEESDFYGNPMGLVIEYELMAEEDELHCHATLDKLIKWRHLQ